jgi:hypothetical protein
VSNVSVTHETIAARRLFRLRHINFDGREKTFYVIDLRIKATPKMPTRAAVPVKAECERKVEGRTARLRTARWRVFMSFGLEIRKHGWAR